MNDPQTSSTFQAPCRHLRSKEMHYQDPSQPEDEFAGGALWCAKTQEAFGPDNDPAGKTECCAGRSCYVE